MTSVAASSQSPANAPPPHPVTASEICSNAVTSLLKLRIKFPSNMVASDSSKTSYKVAPLAHLNAAYAVTRSITSSVLVSPCSNSTF